MVYLYGIVNKDAVVNQNLKGLQEKPISFIHYRSLSAIASECISSDLSINESSVLIHTQVLESVFKESTIIPFQFGTIFDSDIRVRAVLKKNHTDLILKLKHLHNKVEYGFKIWIEPPELKKSNGFPISGKNYLMNKYNHYKQLREMVGVFQEKLKDFCSESRQELHDGKRSFIDLYCLVPKEKVEQFETISKRLNYDNDYFITGPWPPYNFVNQLKHDKIENSYVN